MEPSVLAPGKRKPNAIWLLITLVAGISGAMGAIATGGTGTYEVGPFTMELQARPDAYGKTELAVRKVEQFAPGHAEAGTHKAPMAFRATIVGVNPRSIVSSDRAIVTNPYEMARFMGEEGKGAMRAFAIKLAGLAAAGAAAAGVAISLGRWRRIIGATVAGILALAVVGVMTKQTYDAKEFLKTRFVVESAPSPTDGLPTGNATTGLVPGDLLPS